MNMLYNYSLNWKWEEGAIIHLQKKPQHMRLNTIKKTSCKATEKSIQNDIKCPSLGDNVSALSKRSFSRVSTWKKECGKWVKNENITNTAPPSPVPRGALSHYPPVERKNDNLQRLNNSESALDFLPSGRTLQSVWGLPLYRQIFYRSYSAAVYKHYWVPVRKAII